MKIVIFSLSSRKDNQSLKVSSFLQRRLQNVGITTELVDMNQVKLPVYDDTGEGAWRSIWDPILKHIQEADGYVAVSPEWNGMAAPAWFNMLHYIKHEMAHKPVMLTGVSSGRGGSYPLALMKQAGSKNRHFVISPENLVVGGVESILNDDSLDSSAPDYGVKIRANYALDILVEYAKALKMVRDSGKIDLTTFANGV